MSDTALIINSIFTPSINHIKRDEVLVLLADYVALFERVYFDKDIRENHSIYFPNKKGNMCLL